MRREVEKLLSFDGKAGSFMESPALDVAAKALARTAEPGKKIAFASERSGAREIWTCDSDGSNPVQVTSFRGPAVGMPEWSPDGWSIAFWAFPGGKPYIYVVSADGGVPRRLTTDPPGGNWPNWSGAGRSIYFVTQSGGSSQIYVAPATGGKAIPKRGSPTSDRDDPCPELARRAQATLPYRKEPIARFRSDLG